MIDPYLGKELVIYTVNGNTYRGKFVQRQFLPPHKYLVLKLSKSEGPFDEGHYVKVNTDSIEAFE